MKWMFSDGNQKYEGRSTKVLTLGLPALKTCPGAGPFCKAICYARTGQLGMEIAQRAQHRRWEITKGPNFVRIACDELSRRKWDMVRLGDSGDIYNVSYLRKLCEIAKAFRDRTFFAYTKMVPMVKRFGKLPDNFKVIFSLGGRWDEFVDLHTDNHARVFGTMQELQSAGYRVSPDYLPLSLHENCTREGFVYHGVKLWANCMRDLT